MDEQRLIEELRATSRTDARTARDGVLRALERTRSFRFATEARALLRRTAADERRTLRPLRVAIVGTSTLDHLAMALEPYLIRDGFQPSLYVAPFNQVHQQTLDPSSALYAHAPDLLILAFNHHALRLPPEPRVRLSFEEAEAWAAQEACRLLEAVHAFRQHSSARIMLLVPELPRRSTWGGLSATLPGGDIFLVRELHRALVRQRPAGLHLVDVERLAADFGKRQWEDDRSWLLAKQAWDLDGYPLLAHQVSRVAAGWWGQACKVLALDLDNTLWGGVVGDDGLEGITLGDGPLGEAFVDFQAYVKALQARGILLVIVSKNEEAIVREAFSRRGEMKLAWDDFCAWRINWKSKADNLKSLAEELSLGLDSFCFVDDNPAERALVRELLPDVKVLELPEDAALYLRALDDSGWFELPEFSEVDEVRTRLYRDERDRRELLHQAGSLESFYAQLRQEAFISEFRTESLARLVQLLNKTNQFNVTTRRYSTEQVQAFMQAPEQYWTLEVSLRDRFGDHGLTGLLICRYDAEQAVIDSLVMSCRVIGRWVEHAMVDQLLQWAFHKGIREVRGCFIPTRKNGPAADLFERLGFQKEERAEPSEATFWRRPSAPNGLGQSIPIAIYRAGHAPALEEKVRSA